MSKTNNYEARIVSLEQDMIAICKRVEALKQVDKDLAEKVTSISDELAAEQKRLTEDRKNAAEAKDAMAKLATQESMTSLTEMVKAIKAKQDQPSWYAKPFIAVKAKWAGFKVARAERKAAKAEREKAREKAIRILDLMRAQQMAAARGMSFDDSELKTLLANA